MDTCNYLTKIELAHDDIIVIDSAVPGLGYAIDDERREIAIIRHKGNVAILNRKQALAAAEELKSIIELYGIK